MANELYTVLKAVIELRKTAREFESKLDCKTEAHKEIIPDYHAQLKEKMRLLSRARNMYNRSINKTLK
jgi:Fe-S cluster assembly ATPase SufC